MPVKVRKTETSEEIEAKRRLRERDQAIDRLGRQLSGLRPVRTDPVGLLARDLGLTMPPGQLPVGNVASPRANLGVGFGSFRPENITYGNSSYQLGNNQVNLLLTNVQGNLGQAEFHAGNLSFTSPTGGSRPVGTFRLGDMEIHGPLGVLNLWNNGYRIDSSFTMGNAAIMTNGRFTLQNVQINGQNIGNVQWDGNNFTSGPLKFSFSRGRLSSLEINLSQTTRITASSLGTNTITTPFGDFDLRAAESLFKLNNLGTIRFDRRELEMLGRGDTRFLAPKLGIRAGSAVANEVNRFMSLLQGFPMDLEDFKKQFTVIVQRTPLDSIAYGVAYKPNRNTVISLRHTDAPYVFNFGILHGLGLALPANVSYTDLTAFTRIGRFSLNTSIGAAQIQGVGYSTVSVGKGPTSTLHVPVPRYSVTLPVGELGAGYNITDQLRLGVSAVPRIAPSSEFSLDRFEVKVQPRFSLGINTGDVRFSGYVQPGGHEGPTWTAQMQVRF